MFDEFDNKYFIQKSDKEILKNNQQYHQHIYEKTYNALLSINKNELNRYDQCIEIFFENDELECYKSMIKQKEDFLRVLKDDANEIAIDMTRTSAYTIL